MFDGTSVKYKRGYHPNSHKAVALYARTHGYPLNPPLAVGQVWRTRDPRTHYDLIYIHSLLNEQEVLAEFLTFSGQWCWKARFSRLNRYRFKRENERGYTLIASLPESQDFVLPSRLYRQMVNVGEVYADLNSKWFGKVVRVLAVEHGHAYCEILRPAFGSQYHFAHTHIRVDRLIDRNERGYAKLPETGWEDWDRQTFGEYLLSQRTLRVRPKQPRYHAHLMTPESVVPIKQPLDALGRSLVKV